MNKIIRTRRDTLLQPLQMSGFVECRYLDRCLEIVNRISAMMPSHAGGPGYKGTAASVSADVAIASTGADGAPADSGDDDGDGDGDPDSDRAPHTQQKPRYTEMLQTALDRKRVTVSKRILRMAELKIQIGLSRSTIYEFIKNGQFPQSISLGARAVGWLESDIDAWLESRVNTPKA